MRKLKLVLISVAAMFAFGFMAPSLPARAAAADDVNRIVTELVEEESAIFADGNGDPTVLSQQFKDYAAAAREASDELDAVSAGRNFEEKIDDIRAELDIMAASADDMSNALAAGDDAAYQSAFADFETAYDDMTAAGVAYEQYLRDNPLDSGDEMYILWYVLLIVSVVCLAGAIVMVIATRKQHGSIKGKDGKDVSLKIVRRNVIVGAAIFVVGAAIPAVQYWWGVNHPDPSGKFDYYIFWYPLVIGVFWFIISLITYLTTYSKLKKSGGLAHTDNVAEMAQAGISSDAAADGIRVPKIGEKIEKK